MGKLNRLWNLLSIEHHDLRTKVNTLETEKEVLEETIKDELYKEFMAKLGEPLEMKRLREENKRLRRKIKFYKEEIKNA